MTSQLPKRFIVPSTHHYYAAALRKSITFQLIRDVTGVVKVIEDTHYAPAPADDEILINGVVELTEVREALGIHRLSLTDVVMAGVTDFASSLTTLWRAPKPAHVERIVDYTIPGCRVDRNT